MDESTKKEIGINATKVWDVLNNAVTGISIQELRHQLMMTFEQVFEAIRCLSQKHNIGLDQRDGNLILIGVISETNRK